MLNHTVIETSPQMFKKISTFTTGELSGTKAIRAETIYNATVQFEDIVFDADEDSMNRISRYIQLANYNFNRVCSIGTSPEDAYKQVYVEKLISWKLSDNTIAQVSIETLCKVQEQAVANMTTIWI